VTSFVAAPGDTNPSDATVYHTLKVSRIVTFYLLCTNFIITLLTAVCRFLKIKNWLT